ncbi:hypothetical protein DVH24_041668 [Malus domestica]|uniref:Uncharacterized protein n=1 Tax=Malus domestica TaxID=3750 RepID=A0A498INQ5_MALDO|nr:hypothetical protein DVH24_041668 [Malus domestica]
MQALRWSRDKENETTCHCGMREVQMRSPPEIRGRGKGYKEVYLHLFSHTSTTTTTTTITTKHFPIKWGRLYES